MVMSWIFTGIVGASIFFSIFCGTGSALAASIAQGAQSGITLTISIAGAICLWSGVGRLLEVSGATGVLSRLFQPILHRIFPSSKTDKVLAGYLSANICANFLGLGNAATPMGIQAVKKLQSPAKKDTASDEMCRLIVLNTASIQLIPTTVAAVRASLGCASPFDILPAVWITSICSAGLGTTAAIVIGRFCKHD